MLNENIKKARNNINISQRELGRRIGKTGQYISYLESNPKGNPSLDVLNSIADALNVTVNELLGIINIDHIVKNQRENNIKHEDIIKIIDENERKKDWLKSKKNNEQLKGIPNQYAQVFKQLDINIDEVDKSTEEGIYQLIFIFEKMIEEIKQQHQKELKQYLDEIGIMEIKNKSLEEQLITYEKMIKLVQDTLNKE